jgi:tRNA pseudouridine65 synthase
VIPSSPGPKATALDLPIVFRDEHLAVVSKPSGLVVHPSDAARDRDTCMRRLRRQLRQRVNPVHRLDRGTSGLVVFGLTPEGTRFAAERMRDGSARKRYLAIVRGWTADAGEIDSPLREDEALLPALTRYRRLATTEQPWPVRPFASARYSLLEVEIVSGRWHQVRRHLVHLRHPVVGDVTHGDGHHNRALRERLGSHRLLLHAWRLSLPHPDGRVLELEAPPPEDFSRVTQAFGWV